MARAFVVSAVFDGTLSGVEVWIEYHNGNRRIQSIDWIVPAGVRVRARVYNTGALAVERTVTGPETSSANVPGNRQMVDIGGGVMDLPPEIGYAIEVSNG